MADMELVKELRERINDSLKWDKHREDGYLLRWLLAGNMKVDRAEKMLGESLKWREANDIDRIFETKSDSEFKNDFPFEINGVDKDGRPVLIIATGKWDWDLMKLSGNGKLKELGLYLCYILERMEEAIWEQNSKRDPTSSEPITQGTLVVDWKGHNDSILKNMRAFAYLMTVGAGFENNYPEICSRIVFINCPPHCGALVDRIKPMMSKRTIEKLRVPLSGSEEGECETDEAVLQEFINKDQLDIILGQWRDKELSSETLKDTDG